MRRCAQNIAAERVLLAKETIMKADFAGASELSLEIKDARIANLEEANAELTKKLADLQNDLHIQLTSLKTELAKERALRTWRTDHPPLHQLVLAVIEYPERGKVKLERIVCKVDEEDDLWSESGNNIGYKYKPWFRRFVKWMPLPEISGTRQVNRNRSTGRM
jgi:hypothetical protein